MTDALQKYADELTEISNTYRDFPGISEVAAEHASIAQAEATETNEEIQNGGCNSDNIIRSVE